MNGDLGCDLDADDVPARVHRRQFVIGPTGVEVAPGWRTIDLGSGRVLSADPDLRVGSATDLSGVQWHLLGTAADVRPERAEPTEELKRITAAEVQALYEGWAGRWVLIGAGRLHPDATGMLSIYYGRDGQGALWASSSPVLIKRALGMAETARGTSTAKGAGWKPSPDATVTGQRRGISWYPPPQSDTPGIFRLLPSQVLDLSTGKVSPRRLVAPVKGSPTESQLIDDIAVALRIAVKRLAALSSTQPATVLLSGGRDSRMILAAAVAEKVPLRCYTRMHRRATLADRLLPPKLSRIAGYPHVPQYQRGEIPGRREAILAHSGYNLSWLSAEEFVRGGSDPLTGIALNGLLGGFGRARFMPEQLAEQATGRQIAEYFGEADNPQLDSALDAWLHWYRAHPDPGIDLIDAFHVEQRIAGRKGAKEQTCDLFRFERLAPLSSALIVGMMNALPKETQRSASWNVELIRRLDDRLLAYPMNPPDAHFGLIRGRLLRLATYRGVVGRILGGPNRRGRARVDARA